MKFCDSHEYNNSSRLLQKYKFVNYASINAIVDMSAFGSSMQTQQASQLLRPLHQCLYSIEPRRRIVPFGFKFMYLIQIEINGNALLKVHLPGRQFLIRTDRSFVKVKFAHPNETILIRQENGELGTGRIVSITKDDVYQQVAEISVSDKDFFSIDRVVTVALTRIRKKAQPVVSYGIIAYYRDIKNNTIFYLIVQRRHSIAFLDLIRGKYFNMDRNQMSKVYLSQMTKQEIDMITSTSFDVLWNYVWGHHDLTGPPNPKYITQYHKSAARWQQIDIPALLKDVTVEPFSYPEYGWPKGRPLRNESFLETAEREFIEETNIDIKHHRLDFEPDTLHEPLQEIFQGNNGIDYQHFYALAHFRSSPFQTVQNLNNNNTEIGSVELRTYEECLRLFRPDDSSKRHLLTCVHIRLTNKAFIKDL